MSILTLCSLNAFFVSSSSCCNLSRRGSGTVVGTLGSRRTVCDDVELLMLVGSDSDSDALESDFDRELVRERRFNALPNISIFNGTF
jgi:hypothetical protein